MIRAFVAIAVPEPLAGTLAVAQIGLEVGRLVEPENFHLTLAFLGDQPEPVLADLDDALETISARSFELCVEGFGTFGRARPRVLFAEVVPHKALSELRRRVRRAATEAGITLPRERYHPHITLARMGPAGLPDPAPLQAHVARRMGMVRGTFTATEFSLFESHLGRDGPIYTRLADYPLQEG